MASSNTSTPVKVPSSAASYSAATLDPDLRSQINTLLIKDGHVNKIQDHLLHTLHAHPSNWPTAIQSHALSLLRSGEVTSFPALMRRVMDDVRHQTATNPPAPSSTTTQQQQQQQQQQHQQNGATVVETNGNSSGKKTNGVGGANSDDNKRTNLAVPQAVVEDALRVTRESLEMVCEIEEDGT